MKINSKRFHWTKHIERKMKYYGLSKQRIRRVLKNHNRKELGIAPQTIAVMEKTGTKKRPTEIWLMYQNVRAGEEMVMKMISAWRYPGISPKGQHPIIPEDTLVELEKIKENDKNT